MEGGRYTRRRQNWRGAIVRCFYGAITLPPHFPPPPPTRRRTSQAHEFYVLMFLQNGLPPDDEQDARHQAQRQAHVLPLCDLLCLPPLIGKPDACDKHHARRKRCVCVGWWCGCVKRGRVGEVVGGQSCVWRKDGHTRHTLHTPAALGTSQDTACAGTLRARRASHLAVPHSPQSTYVHAPLPPSLAPRPPQSP